MSDRKPYLDDGKTPRCQAMVQTQHDVSPRQCLRAAKPGTDWCHTHRHMDARPTKDSQS